MIVLGSTHILGEVGGTCEARSGTGWARLISRMRIFFKRLQVLYTSSHRTNTSQISNTPRVGIPGRR